MGDGRWPILDFGQHEGTSLPRVLFEDPDWFFWAIEEGVFDDKPKYRDAAQELKEKAKNIKPPDDDYDDPVVEYTIHPSVHRLGGVDVVERSHPVHRGSSPTTRKDVFDLSMPRRYDDYEKKGAKILISGMKHELFGDSSYRMTEKRCEEFFGDDSNFDV